MSEKANAKPQKYMNLKEILAYSLGLFGFQAIVGLLNSYQAEFYGSIMGANLAIVGVHREELHIIGMVEYQRSLTTLGRLTYFDIHRYRLSSLVSFISRYICNNCCLTIIQHGDLFAIQSNHTICLARIGNVRRARCIFS